MKPYVKREWAVVNGQWSMGKRNYAKDYLKYLVLFRPLTTVVSN